jgi:hypothetical protein
MNSSEKKNKSMELLKNVKTKKNYDNTKVAIVASLFVDV